MKPLLLLLTLATLTMAQQAELKKDRQILFDFRNVRNTMPRKITPATERSVLTRVFRRYLTNQNQCNSQLLLVADVDVDFKENIERKTDLNGDGIDELLMTSGYTNQGTTTDQAALETRPQGKDTVMSRPRSTPRARNRSISQAFDRAREAQDA
jgi:hypothetical protein